MPDVCACSVYSILCLLEFRGNGKKPSEQPEKQPPILEAQPFYSKRTQLKIFCLIKQLSEELQGSSSSSQTHSACHARVFLQHQIRSVSENLYAAICQFVERDCVHTGPDAVFAVMHEAKQSLMNPLQNHGIFDTAHLTNTSYYSEQSIIGCFLRRVMLSFQKSSFESIMVLHEELLAGCGITSTTTSRVEDPLHQAFHVPQDAQEQQADRSCKSSRNKKMGPKIPVCTTVTEMEAVAVRLLQELEAVSGRAVGHLVVRQKDCGGGAHRHRHRHGVEHQVVQQNDDDHSAEDEDARTTRTKTLHRPQLEEDQNIIKFTDLAQHTLQHFIKKVPNNYKLWFLLYEFYILKQQVEVMWN
ncbi:unnamed protein product, partial [Amoebophrya sp. A120]|eukprot:GSA120T00007450001.1